MERKLQLYGMELLGVSQRVLDLSMELEKQGKHDAADKVLDAAQGINGAIAQLGEAVMILQGIEVE